MFGSNFMANFGIPDFPYQGADAQGGMFGANVPSDPMGQNTAPAPAQPGPSAPAQQPSIAAPNPLSGGPLSPGGGQTPQPPAAEPAQPPPAAGIGSPFGKPGV